MLLAQDNQQVPGAPSPRELPVRSGAGWGPAAGRLLASGAVGSRGTGDGGGAEQGQHVPFYTHNHRNDESLFPFIFNPIEKF